MTLLSYLCKSKLDSNENQVFEPICQVNEFGKTANGLIIPYSLLT